MFSFLVALTLYFAFLPSASGSLEDARSFLPQTGEIGAPIYEKIPIKKDPNRLGVDTTARGAIVLDGVTGAVLFEKNADEALPIASLTKLMTALVVLEHGISFNETITLTEVDRRVGAIPILFPGDTVTIEQLFNLMLVSSSNEAAAALARGTGISDLEFQDRMNKKADHLGMHNTRFADPTGLDVGNRATARDAALLVRAAMREPKISTALLLSEYVIKTELGAIRKGKNTDELLGKLQFDGSRLLGGKTGYLHEAGYCFGAAAENKKGNRIIAVALGAASKELRFREVKSLFLWTFDAFTWPDSL